MYLQRFLNIFTCIYIIFIYVICIVLKNKMFNQTSFLCGTGTRNVNLSSDYTYLSIYVHKISANIATVALAAKSFSNGK